MGRGKHREIRLAVMAEQSTGYRLSPSFDGNPCHCCNGEGVYRGRECPRCEGTGADRARDMDEDRPTY